MSFRYDTSQVWLLDLGEADPNLYELCPHHAEHLTVPNGWELVDERSAAVPMIERSANERAAAGRAVSERRADARAADDADDAADAAGRYAGLHSDLPRLAAETGRPGAGIGGERPAPVPSRDLAPPVVGRASDPVGHAGSSAAPGAVGWHEEGSGDAGRGVQG